MTKFSLVRESINGTQSIKVIHSISRDVLFSGESWRCTLTGYDITLLYVSGEYLVIEVV